jgi:Ser/Thr protein kinase RdoA (MazF antagonist)
MVNGPGDRTPEQDECMESDSAGHPYQKLTPDIILDAVESCGYACDGRLLALNSYENRVYQVGVDDDQPVIAKFYRPERWSREAILEEHAFALELAGHEIPVVAPLQDNQRQTLHTAKGFLFAVYPRCGGHWPDLDSREQRLQMGRFLGRMHAVGASRKFRYRSRIDIETLGDAPRRFLLEEEWIPAYLTESYSSLSADLLEKIRNLFFAAGPLHELRLHGDCHPGNILWTEQGPHFVDLDDSRSGPAVQDLWMLLSGGPDDMRRQLDDLLDGYRMFHEFEYSELSLIEALRTLRMMNYAAWVARRWDDPAFPRAFPWFDSPRYWEEHILSLREQAALLDEPFLSTLLH